MGSASGFTCIVVERAYIADTFANSAVVTLPAGFALPQGMPAVSAFQHACEQAVFSNSIGAWFVF
jgi:hypothetical protein